MLKFLRDQLRRLQEQRAGLLAELDQAIAPASTENRSLTAAEQTTFDAVRGRITALDTDIVSAEQRISDAEAIEERTARTVPAEVVPAGVAQRASGSGITVTSEPMTYHRDTRHSYFMDQARIALNRGDGDGGVQAALDRMTRHQQEIDVEFPKREARRRQQAEQEIRTVRDVPQQRRGSVFERGPSAYEHRRSLQERAQEMRVNPNRTDGQGGYFVPPLWLIDEYIDLPRFGRTTANLCRGLTLPNGTDSINLPKIATGTTVAVQTADAGAVSSTDMTDTSVSAPVRTLAGQQDIAIQLLDQSPIAFDEVVFADLLADYNAKWDVQVINGSGSAGQVTGILNTSGINAVTYTDASPTLPELWVPLLQAASLVAKNRKMPATGVVLTPSMWYWAMSQLDTTGRPLIMGNTNMFNAAGVGGELEADGPAGGFTYGMPAWMDGNIPSNLGGGTNETRIITARWSDILAWEGTMRTRVLSEVLSGTLQIRLQVYNYVALMANRRPEAISVIAGTGVIPTSGF